MGQTRGSKSMPWLQITASVPPLPLTWRLPLHIWNGTVRGIRINTVVTVVAAPNIEKHIPFGRAATHQAAVDRGIQPVNTVRPGLTCEIMAGCRHTDWVELSATTRHLRLSDPARLHRLVGQLERAAKQYPQIVLCLGKEEKRKLISQILFCQRIPGSSSTKKSRFGGNPTIVSDKSQSNVDHPIFLAHGRVEGAIPASREHLCHETRFARNVWPASQQGVHDAVLTKLLFPFSDLVCIFVNDLGGFDVALDKLKKWSLTPPATDLADFARRALPRVFLITSGPLDADAQIQEEAARSRLEKIEFRNHFSNVQILRFDTGSLEEFHEDFRPLLLEELTNSNSVKERHRVSFSACHLAEFFSQATLHVGSNPTQKFSFISASRAHRPVPPSYPEQIGVILRNRAKHGVGFDKVTTLISSCLLLDAYPRASHGKSPAMQHQRRPLLAD